MGFEDSREPEMPERQELTGEQAEQEGRQGLTVEERVVYGSFVRALEDRTRDELAPATLTPAAEQYLSDVLDARQARRH